MPNSLADMNWVGSLQDERNYFACDDPLAEVWARVGRFASLKYLTAKMKPSSLTIPLDKLLQYGHIRVRQALEFRDASKESSFLTSPLATYYAYLNLTRAFLALGPDVIPKNAHGLRFVEGPNLLECSAQLVSGTFTDYLDAYKAVWKNGDQLTLKGTLA